MTTLGVLLKSLAVIDWNWFFISSNCLFSFLFIYIYCSGVTENGPSIVELAKPSIVLLSISLNGFLGGNFGLYCSCMVFSMFIFDDWGLSCYLNSSSAFWIWALMRSVDYWVSLGVIIPPFWMLILLVFFLDFLPDLSLLNETNTLALITLPSTIICSESSLISYPE